MINGRLKTENTKLFGCLLQLGRLHDVDNGGGREALKISAVLGLWIIVS